MYRDDPLDDEAELRAVLGDDPVDQLLDAGTGEGITPLELALDLLRVLQGWVDDEAAGRWFLTPQRRLDDRAPVAALVAGAREEVEDAARAWAAAQG